MTRFITDLALFEGVKIPKYHFIYDRNYCTAFNFYDIWYKACFKWLLCRLRDFVYEVKRNDWEFRSWVRDNYPEGSEVPFWVFLH